MKMATYFSTLLLLGLLAVSNSNVLPGSIDVSRLQDVLQSNLKSKEIGPLYYAIRGLKHMNVKLPDVCENIKNAKVNLKNVEQVFYLTNAAYLSNCLRSLKPDVLSAASQVLDKKDATIPELYYAVFSLKALGKGTVYDKEAGLKNLIQLLKKDDSPNNYGLVFGLCEHMGAASWVASHAEAVLLAADESEGRLHFEGGLPVTAQLLTTILRTFRSQQKPAPLSEEQRYKFGAYLYSRRLVGSARGAAVLLEAATALADDQPSPISIAVSGKKFVTPEEDSLLVTVCDLLGRAVRGLRADEVLAQSGTRLLDDVVVLSKQPLTQRDPTTFVLSVSKLKEQYGLYKIALSAGTKFTSVNVAVLGEMSVEGMELGVGEVDGSPPRSSAVVYPASLPSPLHADHMQKVTMKFVVRCGGSQVAVQQAFVRVASLDETRETIFVAEPDSTNHYKVELKVETVGQALGARSGDYSLELVVGDSAAAAPVRWRLATVAFNFNAKKDAEVVSPAVTGPLPEIAHMFRVPEPRPPRIVSDVFAALCAAPLLLLLVLWLCLRINFSGLPLSAVLHAAAFHISLAGWLGLYLWLWLRLSVFEAARYLLPLAAFTFISGHRLLRRLSTKNH